MDSPEFELLKIVAANQDQVLLTRLNEDWFEDSRCKVIFHVWKSDPKYLDPLLLWDKLKTQQVAYVSIDFITSLYEGSYYNFETISQLVENKYLQRQVDKKLDEVKRKLYMSDISKLGAELSNYFFELTRNQSATVKKIAEKAENEGQIITFTNERCVNDVMPRRRSIITIGGDSGHHKSNRAIDMLFDALKANKDNPDFKVLYFSCEMEWSEVRDRVFAKCLGYDVRDIMRKKISEQLLIDEMNLYHPDIIEKFIIIPPEDIKSIADLNKFLISYKPTVWALDYLQLFAQVQAGNRADEQNVKVMESIVACKLSVQLTNSLGILISQIRKKSENRVTHFPRIDDLEWSGQTKHLSHSVGICFWPYCVDSKCNKNVFITSWQKVRNGDRFNEWLYVDPITCRFTKLDSYVQFQNYLNM